MEIIHAEFRDSNLDSKSSWWKVVLITKGDNRYFRGIGIVEVLWRTTMGLLNQSSILTIGFNDILHGFWAGRGTGTSY